MQLTNYEAFALLYEKIPGSAASKNATKLGVALSKVPMRGSASPVAPQQYRSFFVGTVTDSIAAKGSKVRLAFESRCAFVPFYSLLISPSHPIRQQHCRRKTFRRTLEVRIGLSKLACGFLGCT